jgi:hypothetical protein
MDKDWQIWRWTLAPNYNVAGGFFRERGGHFERWDGPAIGWTPTRGEAFMRFVFEGDPTGDRITEEEFLRLTGDDRGDKPAKTLTARRADKTEARFFVRPDKPVSTMTPDERKAFVDKLYEAMTNPKPRSAAAALPADEGTAKPD